MGTKSKLAMAGVFVGVVVTAAAAFGQSGSGSSDGSSQAPNAPRRPRATAQRQEGGRCGYLRPRARRLVHSEATVKVRSGFATLTVDQGEIIAIDHAAKTLTIKRLDGRSVGATATDDTKVCKDGQIAAFDALKRGDLARLVSVTS